MITVLIATHNGARTLPLVLTRLGALLPVPCGHEIIVVDNSSTDATATILQAYQEKLPLRVLYEPVKGKNRALNRALREIPDAALALFIDDDVLPEPDWLQRMLAASQRLPEYSIFGGVIRPHWLAPPPSWLFEWDVPLYMTYGLTTTQQEGPVHGGLVWGGNMAVRGAALREGHRFDEGVGPDGTLTYLMGGETEFTTRMERAGHRAWFVSDSIVNHIIRPEQMSENWLLQRAFRHGRGFPRSCMLPYADRPRLLGLPVGLAMRLGVFGGAAMVARMLPASRRRFHLMWRANWFRGVAETVRRMRTEPTPAAR